jgi:hypothetical protein
MKRTVAAIAAVVAAAGPASAARTDRTPPRVTIATPDGAVRVAAPAPHDVTTVAGGVADAGSGVAAVRVLYCPGGRTAGGGWTCNSTLSPSGIVIVAATVDCADAARRRCTWTAGVPAVPGSYLAFADAQDVAGNRATAGPVTVLVV